MEVRRSDPSLSKLRVYPSSDFIVVYGRALTNDLSVSGRAGTVDTEYRAERVEIPVSRSRPGIIVDMDTHDNAARAWVSFASSCATKDCAFGFIQGVDGRFRLAQVPVQPGYSAPIVYRKRISPRKVMEPTTLYSKTKTTSIYFTRRGASLPVALEIKKTRSVRIDTIVAPQGGVKPGENPGDQPPEKPGDQPQP